MNLFVLTETRAIFQSFLQDYHLREHHGSGGNREGQVHYLRSIDSLRGAGECIVMTWGPYLTGERQCLLDEVRCMPNVVILPVPESRRESARRATYIKNCNYYSESPIASVRRTLRTLED